MPNQREKKNAALLMPNTYTFENHVHNLSTSIHIRFFSEKSITLTANTIKS